MYRILESVEAMDWVSAHQGPAADCGGGGLLLPEKNGKEAPI